MGFNTEHLETMLLVASTVTGLTRKLIHAQLANNPWLSPAACFDRQHYLIDLPGGINHRQKVIQQRSCQTILTHYATTAQKREDALPRILKRLT